MKSYTIKKFKNDEEWLSNRGIGGSDAATIMNKGKWKSKAELYDELIKGVHKKNIKNERMSEGVLSETHIRELFLIHNKKYKAVRPPKRGHWLFIRKDNPMLTLTPDCLLKNTETNKLEFLEIKDIQVYSHKEIDMYLSGAVPSQYLYQCLHYFVVMKELEEGYLLVNANVFEKSIDTDKFVYSHSETYPLHITRENWNADINLLEKQEIKFLKLKERPAMEIDL